MALERTEIIAAALDLLDAVGIDKFSTRALAARLGVAQPALYWHFKSKGALLDAVNEAMLGRAHQHRVPRPGESWEHFCVAHARSMRTALLSVRDGARLAAGTRPTRAQFAEAEQQLALLVKAGFSPQTALHINIGLARFVVGFVLEEQGEREMETEATGGDDARDEMSGFPILSAAVLPLLEEGTVNTDAAFEAGLAFFIEGARRHLPAA